MNCKICGNEASLKLKSHNLKLCEEDFRVFLDRQFRRAVADMEMFSRQEPVLVAVSGGKDSLLCWHLINKLAYKSEGIFLDLGIEGFSSASKNKISNFAKERGLKFKVLKIEELTGFDIRTMLKKKRFCSVCGMIKRYWLNRYAYENGFSVIATGHNLDDESATLLGNILRWQLGYIRRQYPRLDAVGSKLISRVKPLYKMSEYEIKTYADLEGIDYLSDSCPFKKGNTQDVYKEALDLIEEHSPGTKSSFLFQFLDKKKDIFERDEGLCLNECSRCGMLTTQEVCSYCKLIEKEKARYEFQEK
ncbi:MAG: ATP-binding protein [Candidatus Kaelpia aquatica]|nr:ATP-binding protein [Candidatus Kaelpia aquatica]